MITIVIPTRNRGYILEKVVETYYQQKYVDEIIFVDDCSDDNTKEVIENISKRYPQITTKYIKLDKRRGAAFAKATGYMNATNYYILFGEDDVYLSENYTEVLIKKIMANDKVGITSGRIIYKLFNETNQEARKRFGFGLERKKIFDKYRFCINVNAYFEGDIELPMTHSVFLTKKSLLEKFGLDIFYSKGNAYREESDFQINIFVNGYKIICTNDTCCYHINKQEVKTGGQRVNRFRQFYWNVYYTNYLYNKYFDKIKSKLNLNYSKNIAIIVFSVLMFKTLFIDPIGKLPRFLKEKLLNCCENRNYKPLCFLSRRS